MRRTGIVLFLALAALTLPAFVAARRANQQTVSDQILGRWDLTVLGTDAPYSSWLEVVAAKEPGKYHGRFVGRFGSARPVAQLEYREGKLDFTLPPQYEKMTKNLVFSGRLAANKLEGTTEGEDGRQLTWSGIRAPDLIPPKQISWGKSVTLFNGRDITGWKLRSEKGNGCWTVENGMLTNNVPCVDLITNDQFKDFKLHLEFKLAEKSNSGVYLRGRHEVQIVDDHGAAPDNHGMGGLYGFLRPRINAGRAPGEWQTYDVTLIGRFVTVTLNGETVLGGQEIPGITGGALDSDEGTPGPLMLQGDHGKVWFRNITLTPAK
jgi:hypothetical protein